ncbi:MAG: beta-ketoacyl-[acyl-carrier-protein] synthase I [Rhodospirillaceae bacterium]|jgi:3-oxoacyl-[acyl-carrier-protein] synthase-1|uniref:beta-ketoacyl-ACP synthase I n=1 Tax=Hwanghaeella sp. 1Z406 TaxID=3402811 RepID=UPI000C4FCD5F|nr:beta-ketoacyl-[acyl-carrier-protein] synthase I [Rhodospirillales bacterium]MAX47832.1 beta-ketoacyl-[acyl-carrier-protein] synthase I [Rhodospirillaceae bacterium]|tara:strand:+ start:2482 stop:3705 length:1224 start_codon:yes stop_codon:yes gene_type:complete
MNTRRVVITGMGIVSCIGNSQNEVLDSLRNGRSGISHSDDYAERGFRSHVHGKPNIDVSDHIDKKLLRFMGDGAAYNYIAMQQAIDDSGLTDEEVSNERTGLIMGSGGPSTKNMLWAWDTAREKSAKRVGPFMVPRIMSSTNSATLATPFKIKGHNYSISSACSTSAHCIGNGAEMIQWGKQDIVFAGGGEELDWTMTVVFDAMPALSSGYNDDPTKASRAYDKSRDGFVISGGGGVVVLEELEHARARGAKIYGEVVGYGANSDGYDMVQPSGEGAVRCMKLALQGLNEPVGYINTHGTSTPIGDTRELQAIKEVFGDKVPIISSTKSMTGHSLGATGVQEAIYSLLMMKHRFIAPSINIDELDEEAEGLPIARERMDDVDLNLVISNSFGFGGTNATLALRKVTD